MVHLCPRISGPKAPLRLRCGSRRGYGAYRSMEPHLYCGTRQGYAKEALYAARQKLTRLIPGWIAVARQGKRILDRRGGSAPGVASPRSTSVRKKYATPPREPKYQAHIPGHRASRSEVRLPIEAPSAAPRLPPARAGDLSSHPPRLPVEA